jgi:hypothetical protein
VVTGAAVPPVLDFRSAGSVYAAAHILLVTDRNFTLDKGM